MAYFLKKSNFKKGVYLQIYESFYDPERGHTAHKSFKAIGYVHELIEKGTEDPIAFYKEEVAELNRQRKEQLPKKRQRKSLTKLPKNFWDIFH